MGDVNPDFIQPTEFRPNPTSTIEAKGIPVIDISSANDERQKAELAARKFFGLTLEEKKKVRRDEENPLGYYDSEHTKNVRDWKEIFDYTVLDPTLIPASHEIGDEEIRELRNQWPDYPPDFRIEIEQDINRCHTFPPSPG
ncbi:uncharacterized protein LOC110704854 [Chenopodium quinoa]|uniref:uncharacterized protein LOC110704854 n=1 Tax=Chenopodium quinoa TaxID=63459 RepID=UPI000B78F521|nr:uncharacterized protein LOC110704854 [Chenopodium quinoa]